MYAATFTEDEARWVEIARPFFEIVEGATLDGLAPAEVERALRSLRLMIGYTAIDPAKLALKRRAASVARSSTDEDAQVHGNALLASIGEAAWPYCTCFPLRPSWPPAAEAYDAATTPGPALARRQLLATSPLTPDELAEKAKFFAVEAIYNAWVDRLGSGERIDFRRSGQWFDALVLAPHESYADALREDLDREAAQDQLFAKGPEDAPDALIRYVLERGDPAVLAILLGDARSLRCARA